MDKKQRMKLIVAVCFVAVCGMVYLGMHYGSRRSEQPVFEKASTGSALTVEAGGEESAVSRTEKEMQTERPVASGKTPEATAADETKPVYVHVCGAVVKEGVYSLPEGSRVTDCIAAAGGFLEAADTAYHNLAARITDGQKIYVPTVEETRALSVEKRVESGEERKEAASTATDGVKKVNLNTADVTELMTLSGIGEAKAESIIQYREKVGLFQSIEELKKVSGIGDAMFERVRENIVVE